MAEPKLPAFKSDASFNYRLPWDVLNSFSLDGVSAEEEVGNRPCLKGSQEKSIQPSGHTCNWKTGVVGQVEVEQKGQEEHPGYLGSVSPSF